METEKTPRLGREMERTAETDMGIRIDSGNGAATEVQERNRVKNAGRKKQQLRLGGHRGVVRSKLQKLANRFADRRAAWFAGQDTRNTTSLKVHG